MKKIYSLLFTVVGLLAMTSCSEETDPIYVASNATASQLTAINSSYVLSATSSDFATFNFTETDFGVNVAKTYALEASMTEDFASYNQLGTTTTPADGITITAETMNSRMLAWEVEPETAATVYFRVRAAAMDESSQATALEVFSNVISSSITPYSGERVYPSVYVIGDYSSWGWDTAQKLFSFSGDEVNYEGVVDFGSAAANGFKITGQTNWDNGNYGTDGSAIASEASSITLIDDGGSGNISCYSKRFYRFQFNKTTLVLTMNKGFNQMGIIGLNGDWDNDIVMNFDAATQRFYADVEVSSNTEFKFRADADWTFNYGGEGTLTEGGNNIAISAGNYRIYLNMNNSGSVTYEANADDYQAN